MALKDLFLKPDENVRQAAQQAAVQQAAVQQQAVTQPTPQPLACQGGVGIPTGMVEQGAAPAVQPDPEIVEKIWNAIINENRPGPDYLELKNNVEALDGVPLTADQKIVSAFKILNKNYPNFRKEDITSAVEHYIKVVERERTNGLSELGACREYEVKSVADTISVKQQELEELRRKAADLNDEIAEMNARMLAADEGIRQKEAMFLASVEAVMSVLKSDNAKIQEIQF